MKTSTARGNTADSPARRVRVVEPPQPTLFEMAPPEEEWRSEWWGMPSFEMGDARPSYRITVNFHTYEDVLDFAARLGVSTTKKTDSMWFPAEEIAAPSDWRYVDEP